MALTTALLTNSPMMLPVGTAVWKDGDAAEVPGEAEAQGCKLTRAPGYIGRAWRTRLKAVLVAFRMAVLFVNRS